MIKEYTCDRTQGELLEHEGNFYDCKFYWKRFVEKHVGNHFEQPSEESLTTELDIISIELSTSLGTVEIEKGTEKHKELIDLIYDFAIENEE